MRIDSDKTVEEYSNFDFPAIKSDKVDASAEACIEEYLAISKADNESDEDKNGNDNENLRVEFLVSPHGVVKLFDRLIHVDDMSDDDTDFSLAICEKMECVTIQQRKKFPSKTFLNNQMKV